MPRKFRIGEDETPTVMCEVCGRMWPLYEGYSQHNWIDFDGSIQCSNHRPELKPLGPDGLNYLKKNKFFKNFF